MLEIPIKFKQIKYPKSIGKTTGGIFTNAILKIDDNNLLFEHQSPKFLKLIFNQLPIEFDKINNRPNKIYLNSFNEYKILYATTLNNFEITFKLKIKIDFDKLFESWINI